MLSKPSQGLTLLNKRLWSSEIKSLFSTPCRAASRAKLHSVFVESKQQVLLCGISPANIWQTQGEWTRCFFKHVVLELLAIVKTLGARKKIMNITVPKQEKQISLPPTPCQLQPWHFLFPNYITAKECVFLCLMTSDLEKYAIQHNLAHREQRSLTVSKECRISVLVIALLLLNAHHTA